MIRRDTIYLLQQTMHSQPDEPIVLLTAPTGSAAFNIGGITAHSAFMLNTSSSDVNTSFERQATMQVKLEKLSLCVIDEISMFGLSTLRKISSTLSRIKGRWDIDWGGVCVLVVGDLYQLPPVGEQPVYSQKSNVRSPADMAPSLWNDFLFHELTMVMRQRDCDFVQLLNSIHVKQPHQGSQEDIILQSRLLYLPPHDSNYPINAMHVYATNDACTVWNNNRLDMLEGQLFVSTALDTTRDEGTRLLDVQFPSSPRKTGNLLTTLRFKVGTRVMVTTNIDVSDGITNGAMGTICHVISSKDNSCQILAVLVKFDNPAVGTSAQSASKYKHIDPSCVPITKVQASFTIRGRSTCRVTRTQIPLFLCWAVTIHKCQGMTLDEIVVNMNKENGRFQAGQAYVAFSRVTCLQKLHIISYDRSQIKVSAGVDEEMTRLRLSRVPPAPSWSIAENTTDCVKLLHLNVGSLLKKHLDIYSHGLYKYADIISFNETRLAPESVFKLAHIGLENYLILRCDRNRSGGGVIVLVRNSFTVRRIPCNELEAVFVYIECPSPLTILTVYRTPHLNVSTWLPRLNHVISSIHGRFVIIGDLNEDLLSPNTKPINDHLTSMGFTQHVKMPTCDSGSLLDHIYTMDIHDQINTQVLDCYYSDHDIVTCSLPV